METIPEGSTTAGDALRETSVWFVLANPDGWRRGDKQSAAQDPGSEPGFFYQRYDGNGVDMNRDWPTQGFTFRPYPPWSEPETRSYGKSLQAVKDTWTGGIHLHGQLIDRAFSFTLLGASQRPYDKDRRVLQFTKGAWADAEERLAWSSTIKPNDASEDTTFGYDGKAAHLYNPDRITNAGSSGSTAPEHADLPQQEGFSTTIAHTPEDTVSEVFEVE